MCKDCEEAQRLLTSKFGAKDAEFLLWEATCFPMSGAETLRQAKELLAFDTAAAAYAYSEREMDACVERANTLHKDVK